MATGAKWSITGGSSGVLYTERRDFYLHPDKTAELWGNLTPFWSFVTKLASEETNDPDFKLFEHRTKILDDFKFYLNDSAISANVTVGTEQTLTIDNGSGSATDIGVRVGYLVEHRSSTGTYKSVGLVTTYTSTTSIGYTPIWKDGTPAYADNDEFHVIGTAEEEGATSPEAWSDELEVVWGSSQIQKTPVEITGTLLKMTKLRGYSSELQRLRQEKYGEHNLNKNRSFLFGMRYDGMSANSNYLTGSNSRIIRTTLGIVTAIRRHGDSNNKFSRSYSSYTWDDFVDDMELAYNYKNLQGIKYGFCGSGVLGFFSKKDTSLLGNSSFAFNVNADKVPTRFGFNIKEIEHPYGVLKLVYEPALRGRYSDTMVLVDPEHVKRVVFRNSVYQAAIQANDADLVKDQYFSDEGLGIDLIEMHSLFEFSS